MNDMTVLALHPGDLYGFEELVPDEDKALLARVREFAETEVAPSASAWWEAAEFPFDLIPKFADLDIVGLSYDWPDRPARSRLTASFVAMELARADPSISTFFGVHSGLALGSIQLCGSDEQRDRWLPAMRTMEKIGAFALTEPEAGSDVARGLRTTAQRDGDEWVLNGQKRWIGNGTFADLVVIWARDVDDDHVKGFVVHKENPGFKATKIERKLALRTVQNADIELTDCHVPDGDHLAGANSFADTARVLKLTRGGVGWSAVGAMMRVFELAVDYAKNRHQFGRPLASFQLIQEHLTTILANLSSTLALSVRIATLQDEGRFDDTQAALVKMLATTKLRESVARAREVFGGNGILLDYDVARFFNDAEALYSYEGTREMNTLIVGRAITGVGAFV